MKSSRRSEREARARAILLVTAKWHDRAACSRTADFGGRRFSPRWRGDGKELYYISAAGDLVAVSVETEADSFRVGSSTPLFQTTFEPGKSFDVTADGEAFFISEVSVSMDTPISLIVNWDQGLNQ